ncbi:hypothetical protein OG552_31015 [Streptomyces sp. NBC_01476]|uniref:LAETG motif-containing sortase-dependent surface protein n=1 Tax=Streptomyces sp. NBC_01476 TaxID=2903881 RepID=UPI002E345C80|nr:LAETG motif-containing sortase-dependent surface protein [Streptomyces sp. NBC_01476]
MFARYGVAAAGAAATVMMVGGTAFAAGADARAAAGPAIGDFVVAPRAVCDTGTGAAKAAITVTDKDASGTPADISVRIRLASGYDSGGDLATAHVTHPTAAGTTVRLLVDWKPGYQWNVRVTAGDLSDALTSTLPISDDTPCVVPTSAGPSASASTSAGAGGSSSSSATPSVPLDAPSTGPAAAVSPVAASGGSGLAETGGGSDTGLIAGAAAVVIAGGCGTLIAVRRRTSARH